MRNIEKGFTFESGENQEELVKKIESITAEQEKENESEEEKLIQELSSEESSTFKNAKKKIDKGIKIGVVGALIVTSLLAAGCKAEEPKTTQWEQTNIEEAKEAIPQEVREEWILASLDSMGWGWRQNEKGFVLMMNAGSHYEINEENLEEFKEKLDDYITKYMYHELSKDITYIDKEGKELIPEERASMMMSNKLKANSFGRHIKENSGIAQDLFEKSSQEKWEQAGDNIYFSAEESDEAEESGEEQNSQVRESPPFDDPTLK
jgi:hypothetical protein